MNASILRLIGGAVGDAHEGARPAPMTIESLFSAHVGFVWRSLRHLGVARSDLDDQTQEVFIVAHRRLSEWDGAHPRAWLYAIARRCAASYRRRSHRRHERAVETLPESTDTRDLSDRMDMARLRHVVDALDEEKRAVFILYEVEQMTMREVAEALKCTLPTAYARLYAARRELARALEEEK